MRSDATADPENKRSLRSRSDAKVDAARALILHEEKGLTYAEIAKIYGCSTEAVGSAIRPLKRIFGLVGNGRASKEYRSVESKILDTIRTLLADQMLDEEKLKKASLRDLAFVFREVFQAHRLLDEKSTANVALRADLVMAAHGRPIYEDEEEVEGGA